MTEGCSTVARPVALHRCPTNNQYSSDSYIEGRASEQPSERRADKYTEGEAKGTDIGSPTPPDSPFSSSYQTVRCGPPQIEKVAHSPISGPQNGIWIPCPSEVFEASSAISECGQNSYTQADLAALTSFGFESWDSLTAAHADWILAALEHLPPACDATGQRLVDLTRWFLNTASWAACVENGWPLSDVFGVAEWTPQQRRDVLGLVPALAFSPKRGRRIESVTSADATLRDLDGRSIIFRRPSLNADLSGVVPWWESPVLVSREAA